MLELSDKATGASGKLTDMVIGKAVDGDYAGSQIKQLNEMAELDYQIAQANRPRAALYQGPSPCLHP